MNVYVRGEYEYSWELESVVRILQGDFDISVLNGHYPQERFPKGGGGNMSD